MPVFTEIGENASIQGQADHATTKLDATASSLNMQLSSRPGMNAVVDAAKSRG
jgi:hypothetical protein